MTKYNCQTLPKELRSKQNARWNAHGALAELVDNSFGPARGNASEVIIFYDPRRRTLDVLDNGVGMDHIGRLFQGGNSIGRAVGDIGEYGAGGSLAVLWLATMVDIWTMRGDGRVMFDTVIWKEWIAASSFKHLGVSDDWVPATVSNTPPELLTLGHGTLIRLHLMPKRKIDGAKIRHELARLYSPGLRKGKKVTWQTMRKKEVLDSMTLADAFVAPSPRAETVNFDLMVEYEGNTLPVNGRVFYDEATTQADSKLQLGFGYRIIRAATECFQSADRDEKYPGIGVSGWLDLGDPWRPYLTTTKDDIDDEPLFDALMGYVFEKIKPMLKKSQQKMFSLQFEDLRVGLERSLNLRAGGQIAILVQGQDIPDIVDHGNDRDVGDEREREAPPETGPREQHAPPRLTIKLIPLPDARMGGHLCRSQIINDTIEVYINSEHPVIVEAIMAKPINRMLLHQVVIGELGGELALDQYEPFIAKLFRPGDARAINDIDDQRDKARTLTRVLVDRVRTAPPSSEPEKEAA